jgi:NAD(P)-dependent dehydrogenase (short-subunit alcohol dehydrogenase family)
MPMRAWFITGCSSGLGRALAERLLARGQRVAATARDLGALRGLADGAADRLWVGRLDVTDHDEIRQRMADAFQALGRIDVVISNAGYGLFGAAEEVSDAQLRRQILTNLVGPIQVARTALPYLRAQGSGRLVQISSVAGQTSGPCLSLYHATKWGVEGFFEALAAEVAPFGIQVTIVEPGAVRTGFGAGRDDAEPLAAYESTRVGVIRRAVRRGKVPVPGDLSKMADAVIDAAGRDEPPRRLVLGSDAYLQVEAALRERLAVLTAQRDLAMSTDRSR